MCVRTAQELCLLAMALANWKLRPPNTWMARLIAVSQPQLPFFSPQARAHVWSFVDVRIHVSGLSAQSLLWLTWMWQPLGMQPHVSVPCPSTRPAPALA